MATHHYFRSKDEKFLDRVLGRELLLNLLDLAVRCDGVVNGVFEINIILAGAGEEQEESPMIALD